MPRPGPSSVTMVTPTPHPKPSPLPNSPHRRPRPPQAAQRSPLSEPEGSRPKEMGGKEGGRAPGGWKESPDFPALSSTRVGQGPRGLF